MDMVQKLVIAAVIVICLGFMRLIGKKYKK
jgi:hypothetical protein